MIEIFGEMWDYHDKGEWVAVTTNGSVRDTCDLIMGGGCAFEAKERYPNLPMFLGHYVYKYGNQPYIYGPGRIISFPTKDEVWLDSKINLIEKSAFELYTILNNFAIKRIYIPRPGCGLGRLKWEDVKPVLEKHLIDDRFIIITNEK